MKEVNEVKKVKEGKEVRKVKEGKEVRKVKEVKEAKRKVKPYILLFLKGNTSSCAQEKF